MTTIYHITTRAKWETAVTSGWYATDSLHSEGFIHCSTAQQIVTTANRLFRGRKDLVLLCIDSERVRAEIRYENLEGGAGLFPHIYGMLATRAVMAVHPLAPRIDGSFPRPAVLTPPEAK